MTGRTAKALADARDGAASRLEPTPAPATSCPEVVGDGLRQPRADLLPARARPRHARADRGAPARACSRRCARIPGSASCSCAPSATARSCSARRAAGGCATTPSRARTRSRRSARTPPSTCAAPTRFPHCPDIVVNSTLLGGLDEVAAFEELVGSHGGLGGGQAHPFVLHPARPAVAGRARSSAPKRSTASCAAGSRSSARTAYDAVCELEPPRRRRASRRASRRHARDLSRERQRPARSARRSWRRDRADRQERPPVDRDRDPRRDERDCARGRALGVEVARARVTGPSPRSGSARRRRAPRSASIARVEVGVAGEPDAARRGSRACRSSAPGRDGGGRRARPARPRPRRRRS